MNSFNKSFPQLQLPSPFAGGLVDQLTERHEFRQVISETRLDRIQNNINVCHFVKSGHIYFCREKDDIIISTVQSPFIFGLIEGDFPQFEFFIETVDVCEIATIQQSIAIERVQRLHLWEPLAKHTVYALSKLLAYMEMAITPTAYEVIRFQLMELMKEPLEVRNNNSVISYLTKKTTISRSAIFKILAHLKSGAFITIENGRLISVANLPKKY